jgi:hypothetical protein
MIYCLAIRTPTAERPAGPCASNPFSFWQLIDKLMIHRPDISSWMRSTLIFLVITFISTVAMPFQCVHPCSSVFSARAGLSRHQNDCTLYRTSQALKQEQRRAHQAIAPKAKVPAHHGKPSMTARDLDRRKERIGYLEAHVSIIYSTAPGPIS